MLAVLNVASIGVFVWKDFGHHSPQNGRPPRPEDFENGQPPRPQNGQDISTILEKELHLTPIQVTQIQALRNDFFEKERLLSQSIGAKRDSMNAAMFNKMTDEMLIKFLARGIAESEYQMEMLRFEQANAFKAVCTPEQLAQFNALVIEIRDYFQPHK